MRALLLSYEFPPLGGGGAHVVRDLSRELTRLGHQVDLVTMGYRGLPRHEVVDGVAVHRVRCVRRKPFVCTIPEAATYLAGALPVVLGLAARHRYDIIHAHFIFPDGLLAWAASRLRQTPFVITAHGSDVPGYNPHRLILAHKLLTPFWHLVVHAARCIICPSAWLQELIRRRCRRGRLTVLPNGILLTKFQSGQARQARVLVVTRMLERKGVQYVLEAVSRLERPCPVHLVGDGPYLPALRAQAERLKLPVTFWGWMDNSSPQLKELYETSRIFALPSEAENFPIVLLEAMAAGAAIITSQGTGCAEVVGEAALLVPPKDAAAIGKAVTTLLGEPALAERLGQAARTRIEQRFSWGAVATSHVALYEQQLQNGAVR